MNLIKLNATESTNTYLKNYSSTNDVDNFTVVWAMDQTMGRGQMGNRWISEKGKSLTFSVLVNKLDLPLSQQFYLSKAVSLGVFNVLVKVLPNLITIKWPNDIMAGSKKLGGILIENKIKRGSLSASVIGVGLNVNQVNFTEVSNAISLKGLTEINYDLEELLNDLVDSIKGQLLKLKQNSHEQLDAEYHEKLYRFEQPSMFQIMDGEPFMARIVGVSDEGRLRLELDTGLYKEFDIKEIKFI